MSLNAIISFSGAFVACAVALFALLRDHRSFAHRAFALGMLAQGVEAAAIGLCMTADSPQQVMAWQGVRLLSGGAIPGIWLAFSLGFARVDPREALRSWKWGLAAVFSVPLGLVLFLGRHHFSHEPVFFETTGWAIPLGWSGLLFHVVGILCAALVLMNLERALRASVGRIRWQIKFLLVGVGGLIAVRIYSGSQALLFRTVDISVETVHGGALILAGLVIFIGLLRARLMNMNVYPSPSVVYNSLAVFFVGAYLVAVGVMAELVGHLGASVTLPLQALLVLVAVLGLAVLLLSDRIRLRLRTLIWRHLKRPQYDYRLVWRAFTEKTSSLLEQDELCRAVSELIAKTFEALSVSVWLLDEGGDGLILAGSTVLSGPPGHDQSGAAGALIRAMEDQHLTVDLQGEEGWAAGLKGAHAQYLSANKMRYCVALRAGDDYLGLLTLDDRVKGVPLTPEELDLLKTMADQTAASLQNLRLTQRVQRAKEMEAFQTVSAFFVHDLKNLAASLSLLLQNLPLHYEDPEFRKDALSLISANVEKIQGLMTKLSSFRNGIALHRSPVQINEIVTQLLGQLNGALGSDISLDLRASSIVQADPQQIQKVLHNLVLNADEARTDPGLIRITTYQRNRWVVLEVTDNGIGMSDEFIHKSLFRPFRTTKKKGLGIGLYHSKAIVEAHGGRVEVESEPGKGSTFRVLLPASQEGE